MASGGEAVAENVSYLQKLDLFSASLWRDLWTQVSVVRCASYIAVATPPLINGFRNEAVAENASYLQKLTFFSAFLWRNLWTRVSPVCCASCITVATTRVELSERKVFDKKKKKKKE